MAKSKTFKVRVEGKTFELVGFARLILSDGGIYPGSSDYNNPRIALTVAPQGSTSEYAQDPRPDRVPAQPDHGRSQPRQARERLQPARHLWKGPVMSTISVEYPSGKVGDVGAPTVHLNGSAGATLRDAYDSAISALLDALGALYAANPNARDYYTAGSYSFAAARRDHDRRLAALRDVQAELTALRDNVQDQVDALARR